MYAYVSVGSGECLYLTSNFSMHFQVLVVLGKKVLSRERMQLTVFPLQSEYLHLQITNCALSCTFGASAYRHLI